MWRSLSGLMREQARGRGREGGGGGLGVIPHFTLPQMSLIAVAKNDNWNNVEMWCQYCFFIMVLILLIPCFCNII